MWREEDREAGGERVLEPGRTCWRRERAGRFGLIEETARYFRAAAEAIWRARHQVWIVGWDLHGDVELVRGEQAEQVEYPSTLVELLTEAARRRPELQIRMLIWDYSM